MLLGDWRGDVFLIKTDLWICFGFLPRAKMPCFTEKEDKQTHAKGSCEACGPVCACPSSQGFQSTLGPLATHLTLPWRKSSRSSMPLIIMRRALFGLVGGHLFHAWIYALPTKILVTVLFLCADLGLRRGLMLVPHRDRTCSRQRLCAGRRSLLGWTRTHFALDTMSLAIESHCVSLETLQ